MGYFQGPNVNLPEGNTYITYKKAPLNLRVPLFKTSPQDLEARTQESLNQFIDSQANSGVKIEI